MKNNPLSILSLQNKYHHINKLDFILLLCYASKKTKEFILAHEEYTLNFFEYLKLKLALKKYKQGFSIATITHHKEFCDLNFYVNKHTLIPRPETELMVEEAVNYINEELIKNKTQNILMIDIGTGSGCIPISILKKLEHKNLKTIATDISNKALKIAKRNAVIHNVNINFLGGDLLEPILKNNSIIQHCINAKIILTANLPYLTDEQFKTELSIQKEPYTALVAQKDGLKLYEKLLEQIQKAYSTYHLSLVAFFEIDPSQTETIISFIKKFFPQNSVHIKKDFKNQDRLVCFKDTN